MIHVFAVLCWFCIFRKPNTLQPAVFIILVMSYRTDRSVLLTYVSKFRCVRAVDAKLENVANKISFDYCQPIIAKTILTFRDGDSSSLTSSPILVFNKTASIWSCHVMTPRFLLNHHHPDPVPVWKTTSSQRSKRPPWSVQYLFLAGSTTLSLPFDPLCDNLNSLHSGTFSALLIAWCHSGPPPSPLVLDRLSYISSASDRNSRSSAVWLGSRKEIVWKWCFPDCSAHLVETLVL